MRACTWSALKGVPTPWQIPQDSPSDVVFEAAWDDIRHLGFDERFRKLWKFYLSYCEAGFRTERTNVVQLSLAKA